MNTPTFRGTPLAWAVGHNAILGAHWLLDHGTDPNLRHDFGNAEHGKDIVGAVESVRLLKQLT